MKTFLLLLAAALAAPLAAQQTPIHVAARDPEGFAYATPSPQFQFPRDHGSHPEFKTEWWYLTGHLETQSPARSLGFQLTFFRSGNKPGDPAAQFYMAHAAIVDKATGRFLHEERLNAADWNADAATGHLDLYNGNWYLRMDDPAAETMQARFSLAALGEFSLAFAPLKPKTLFGQDGYSRKADAPGAASYYITFTRLAVSGNATIDGKTSPLSGTAWMDHEFSSSQLAPGQVGWNWTSIHFDDGSELMAYVMRRDDGSYDTTSTLTLVDADGQTTALDSHQFDWRPLRHWTSPASGASYPVEYELSWQPPAPAPRRSVTIVPYADAQELTGRVGDFVYWEGACRVLDSNSRPIGQAYTELTGYNESLQGKF